ncbi:MAG TPA: hypothetical protein VIM11_26840 [Tepidisphaeraceae bacterium]|jgi:hypothetical protein
MSKEISWNQKEARKLSLLFLITADKALDCGCPDSETFAELARQAFESATEDRDMA